MTSDQQQRPTSERAADRAWFIEVLGALDRLHPTDGEILRLTYMSGLARADIARRLELPESTVGSLLARGMRALGDSLSGWGQPAARP